MALSIISPAFKVRLVGRVENLEDRKWVRKRKIEYKKYLVFSYMRLVEMMEKLRDK